MSQLDSRWESLTTDPLHMVFQLYDSEHPMDFYIGKDTENHRLLLLITSEVPPGIRDMRAIRIRSFKRDDGKWSVLLTLENIALAPMFSMLCNDLIESSRHSGLPVERSLGFVLARLSNWRRLFERGLPDLLSENQIRGLCGELLFLQRLFEHLGKADAVRAWVGPRLADQDFQLPDGAWEVKTVRPAAHSVAIASESQLHVTSRPISLVVFELADSAAHAANAFTLTGLVNDIRTILAKDYDAGELFEDSLCAAGYVARPEYEAQAFTKRGLAMYAIAPGFPCITPETIAPGISHVGYDVLLTACEPFRMIPPVFMAQKGY